MQNIYITNLADIAKNYRTNKGIGTTMEDAFLKAKEMKRIGNLYSEIISIENLNNADKKAQKGKLKQYGAQRF